MFSSTRYLLMFIILLAFGLRVGVALLEPPLNPYERAAGGDEWWYLEYGYRQVTDRQMEPLSSAPLYLVLVGGIRYTLQPQRTEKVVIPAPPGGGLRLKSVPGAPSAATVRIMQVLQAAMGAATCYFLFLIGRGLLNQRVGLVAASVWAVSLASIMSARDIMTETTYIFFITWGIALYTRLITESFERSLGLHIAVGVLFGLATLTRAAFLLFPLGVAAHAILLMGISRRTQHPVSLTRHGLAVLLMLYALVCSTWTAYYYVRWGEVVIGAKGFSAFLYLGTQDDVADPETIDASLGATRTNPINDADYTEGALEVINANPVAYIIGRANSLLTTYAQPHATESFPGESLKALLMTWWRTERNAAGLLRVIQGDAFLPKFLIYLVHGGGIGLGLIGSVLTWRQWRVSLVLGGFIAYVSLLHLVLLALPRYLYPTLPFWWVYGAATLIMGWDWLRMPRRKTAIS